MFLVSFKAKLKLCSELENGPWLSTRFLRELERFWYASNIHSPLLPLKNRPAPVSAENMPTCQRGHSSASPADGGDQRSMSGQAGCKHTGCVWLPTHIPNKDAGSPPLYPLPWGWILNRCWGASFNHAGEGNSRNGRNSKTGQSQGRVSILGGTPTQGPAWAVPLLMLK